MPLAISYITGVDTFPREERSIAHRPRDPSALGPVITARMSTMKTKKVGLAESKTGSRILDKRIILT